MVLILLDNRVLEVGVAKKGSEAEVVVAFVASIVTIGSVVVVAEVAATEVAGIEAEAGAGAALAGILVGGSKKNLVVRMGPREVGVEIIGQGIEEVGFAVFVVEVAEHLEPGVPVVDVMELL